MKTYYITFRYSKDGKSWVGSSANVKAESETGAIMQIQSKYPFVTEIRIRSVNGKSV